MDSSNLAKELNNNQFRVIPVVAWEVRPQNRHLYFQAERNIFKRVTANLIDYAAIAIFYSPIYFYLIQAFSFIKGPPYHYNQYREIIEIIEFLTIKTSILFSICAYYYLFYQYKTTTIGKRYFRLKAYRYNSLEPIGLVRIFFREIVFKLISTILFPSTIIHFLLQKEGLFIHDVLSKTFVVKDID